eukprot:TRINITY_DN4965_c0_g1_i1.p1 TRINITY_DN4965_c0_g1~~TRINITY_DN4965_c0_g1_i1.p1  ORF type:complete len:599 (-),score=206.89 TRINITY_DN4965_c0_g1_i1:265-2061(-)
MDFGGFGGGGNQEITPEKCEPDYINRCDDSAELEAILSTLKNGTYGKYEHIEQICEDRILAIGNERAKSKIFRKKSSIISPEDERNAQADVDRFISEINIKSDYRKKSSKSKSLFGDIESKYVPPIRGESKEGESNENNANNSKKSKIDSKAKPFKQYYDEWGKFNDKTADITVNDVLSATRDSEESKNDDELSKTPAEDDRYTHLTQNERENLANREKVKGNESFRSKDYNEAVQYYSKSLQLCENNVVYANRAMTRLRLKQYSKAEEDATRSIEIDNTFMKAWFRRGLARQSRGKYLEAVGDFEKALQLVPENKEAQKALRVATDKFKEVEGETVEEARWKMRFMVDRKSNVSEAKAAATRGPMIEVIDNEDVIEEEEPVATSRLIIEESDSEDEEEIERIRMEEELAEQRKRRTGTSVMIEEISDDDEEEEEEDVQINTHKQHVKELTIEPPSPKADEISSATLTPTPKVSNKSKKSKKFKKKVVDVYELDHLARTCSPAEFATILLDLPKRFFRDLGVPLESETITPIINALFHLLESDKSKSLFKVLSKFCKLNKAELAVMLMPKNAKSNLKMLIDQFDEPDKGMMNMRSLLL